ncbi:phage tail family protein [Cytobacillus praedii]|uniref:Phage tail family protein n=1 Tax=Cytobacillus praedii TaxID=1742358 RepID=A0A4R1AWS7_9BACI|nr:phage tail family protein [Cytobacillus praedii]TCJ01573.1 phage tail family protein [Cytobacillus praedii]
MIFIDSLNGYRYDLMSLGIHPLKLIPDSLSPRHESEVLEGMDGHIDIVTTYEGRTLSASFFIESLDGYDFNQLRNQVYGLFNGKSYFYVIDVKEPKKRWKVKTATKFTVDKLSRIAGTFDLALVSPSPYVESIGTTLDELTFDKEKWQVGQGLVLENPEYVHQLSTFKIFNAGDVTVDSCQMPLKIIFKGESTNLQIKNLTTGDTWAYTGITGVNDTITLDGIRSLMNGVSVFGQTNKKLLSIAPGWNDFEIMGATDFLISFDFRFYYY